MFGKKKEPEVKAPTAREILATRIIGELEQMTQVQSLIYKLPQEFWNAFGAFLIVELNPTYPQKGKKFCTYVDNIEDGKPAGKRRDLGQNNKPKDVADWIAQSEGAFGSLERYQ
jgi:hypothetical protein